MPAKTLDVTGERLKSEAFFKDHPNLLRFPVDKLIKEVAFIQWPGSNAISCLIVCQNGHEETASSHPRKTTHFDLNTGIEAAFMRCRDQLWQILSFTERDAV